jgi:putative oxidoreductase
MEAYPTENKFLRIADWTARLVAAAILLQTLFFKFTAAPESVYIFTAVGQEPWGRWGSGIAELIASILLFVPGKTALGALIAAGAMCGALFFHLTKLGVAVQGDGGLLFGLALLVLGCSGFLVFLHRRTLPVVGANL